jgi:glycosyltransferase involved in cell wall biosynthesis
VARELPESRFLWVGKDTPTAPNGKTWAQHCAEKYPHLTNVDFVGSCSDQQLASYYAESAAYLCTSQYESFGLTLVEAMHAALPVVAPRAAAMPELVTGGRTGCLYEPGHAEECSAALQDLLLKPADSQAMGECGQLVAQKEFSVERMTDRVLDLYRSVC